MPDNVCLIIPAFNCADTIESVINGARPYIRRILVADDGSSDATADIARKAGARVIRLDRNRGKGHALQILFAEAAAGGCTAVISMDADGQHNPEDIPRFLSAHRRHPDAIILGSRMHDQAKIPRSRFNSMRVARYYVALAANQFIDDTQCGFRLYPLTLVRSITLTTQRYVTETEILMKAGDMGAAILPVPVTTVYGQQVSHFRPVSDVSSITTYVIFYLTVKWILEVIRSDCPFTYGPGDIRDRIGRRPSLVIAAQAAAVMTVLLTPLALWIVHGITAGDPGHRLASLRRRNVRIAEITFVTHALPILLVLPLIQRLLALAGRHNTLAEGYIAAVMAVAGNK